MTAAATDTLQSGAKRTESRFPVNVDLNDNDMDVRVGRKIFRIGYAPGDVQDYNTRFIKTLEEIRMRTGKELTLSDADYGYFMKELRDIGSGAYAFLRKAGIGEYIQ